MRTVRPAAIGRLLAAALLLAVTPALLAGTAATAPATSARNLDVVVVVDNALYVQLGSSVAAAEEFAATVIDGILPITAPDLAMRVRTVDTIVLTAGDPWTPTLTPSGEVNSSSLLALFRLWAGANLTTPRDQAILLSGRNFEGSTVGLAPVSAACSNPDDVGVIVQATFSAAYVSTIVAHEIGHTLGMQHDSTGNACPANGFIMQAVGCSDCGTLASQYSSCSLAYFATWLASVSSAECLYDDVSSCGNGVHQAGEQCDCGLDCANDACCTAWWTADGCKLEPGCTCSPSDGCCNAGVPAAAGTVCRSAASQCDVAEQCDGTSPFCPPDLQEPIGTACGSDGACGVDGACSSATEQCIALGSAYGLSLVGSCPVFTTCGRIACTMQGGSCTTLTQPGGGNVPPADGTPCGAGSVCEAGACVPVSTFDGCPDDPDKTAEGVCGCSIPDLDTDADGIVDCVDRCPLAGTGIAPGALCTYWTTDAFSDCSAACGGGTQTRTVSCTDGASSYDVAACADAGPEPPSEQACNVQECVDDQTILGGQILVKDPKPGVPEKRSLVVAGKESNSSDTVVGDPTTGGATLRIDVTGTATATQTFTLPAAGWKATKTGFKYADSKLLLGPVKSALIQVSKGKFQLKAVLGGKTGAIALLPPNPGASACAVFEIAGGDRYHVSFPGPPDAKIAKNDAKTFQVNKVLVEGLCP